MKPQLILFVAVLAACNAQLYFQIPDQDYYRFPTQRIYVMDVATGKAEMVYRGDFSTFTYNPTDSNLYTFTRNSTGTFLTAIDSRGHILGIFEVVFDGVAVNGYVEVWYLTWSRTRNVLIGAGTWHGGDHKLFYFNMSPRGAVYYRTYSNHRFSQATFTYNDQNSTLYASLTGGQGDPMTFATWNSKSNEEGSVRKYEMTVESGEPLVIAYGPYLMASMSFPRSGNWDDGRNAGYASIVEKGDVDVAKPQFLSTYADIDYTYTSSFTWDSANQVWYAIEHAERKYYLVAYDSEGTATRKGEINIPPMNRFYDFHLLLA